MKHYSRVCGRRVQPLADLMRLGALTLLLTLPVGCGDTSSTPDPDGGGTDTTLPDAQEDGNPGPTFQPLPAEYTTLNSAVPTRKLYVSQDHACANPALNDGSVDACNGTAGPFASFAELGQSGFVVAPGDALVIRNGTYAMTNLGMSQASTATAPIQIVAYPGESPVFDGGYDGTQQTINPDRVMVSVSGSYLVIKGITFVGCHRTCMLVTGQHILVQGNTFTGGEEDGLKTSGANSDVYIVGNTFSYTTPYNPARTSTPEAIDGFHSTRVWVTQNEFTNSNVDQGGWGSVAWFKAGADTVYFFDNHIHDVRVSSSGVIMGGCCFNNWDWEPDSPVGRNIVVQDNRFERVTFASNYRFRGTIMAQGCHGCGAYNNVIRDCEAGLSVRSTEADGEPVPDHVLVSTDVTFEGNEVHGTAVLVAIEEGLRINLDNNTYSCSTPQFRLGDQDLDLGQWHSAGFDPNSSVCD